MFRFKTKEEIISQYGIEHARGGDGDEYKLESWFRRDNGFGMPVDQMLCIKEIHLRRNRNFTMHTPTNARGREIGFTSNGDRPWENNSVEIINKWLRKEEGYEEVAALCGYLYAFSVNQDNYTNMDSGYAKTMYIERWMFTSMYECVVQSRYGVRKGSIIMPKSEAFGRVVETITHDKDKNYMVSTECGGKFPIHSVRLVNTKKDIF